jgi:hypothetical protein
MSLSAIFPSWANSNTRVRVTILKNVFAHVYKYYVGFTQFIASTVQISLILNVLSEQVACQQVLSTQLLHQPLEPELSRELQQGISRLALTPFYQPDEAQVPERERNDLQAQPVAEQKLALASHAVYT